MDNAQVRDETLAERRRAAWAAAGVDLSQPIPLVHARTIGGQPVAGCYYDGPAATAWWTRYGATHTCAVPDCGKAITSGYHGCIVPGMHPIMVCGDHVVYVKAKRRRARK